MNSHQDHILVVDDDPEIRHLMQSHLEKNGSQVSTAAEGGGMWQALERSRIDLIVLDLMRRPRTGSPSPAGRWVPAPCT
ncbi:MAG: response regulator [Chromatiales bacterium]|jgi:two-component system OmpR family response regulator